MLEREIGMDRLLAQGTVNAAQSGNGPPLFLFHSLLSDRASFDAIVPELSKSHRVIVPDFQAGHPELMADRGQAFLRTDPQVFRAACDALAGLDLRPELDKVKMPVLVVVGEHDEATPPPMSHELAAGLPQAHLKIIPGCAHVPQLQSPAIFLEMIGAFLPRANSAPA